MHLTNLLVVVTVASVYSLRTDATTDLSTVTTSDAPPDMVRSLAGALTNGKRSLRKAGWGSVDEDRGFFRSSSWKKLVPGLENLNKSQIKAQWLKNASLYDELRKADDQELMKVFMIWHGLGYSDSKVRKAIASVMKKAGENPNDYKNIAERYKDFRTNVAPNLSFQ